MTIDEAEAILTWGGGVLVLVLFLYAIIKCTGEEDQWLDD